MLFTATQQTKLQKRPSHSQRLHCTKKVRGKHARPHTPSLPFSATLPLTESMCRRRAMPLYCVYIFNCSMLRATEQMERMQPVVPGGPKTHWPALLPLCRVSLGLLMGARLLLVLSLDTNRLQDVAPAVSCFWRRGDIFFAQFSQSSHYERKTSNICSNI